MKEDLKNIDYFGLNLAIFSPLKNLHFQIARKPQANVVVNNCQQNIAIQRYCFRHVIILG